jgi:Zn-dependent protease
MTDFGALIQGICISALPIIFAVTLHEVAHGYVAYWCGDYTAKLSGRLSLNPIKHIDPMGTIIIPFLMLLLSNFRFLFGWAKPVPVDARNMRHPRRDMALVASAGPLSNLLMAVLWGLVAKLGLILASGGNLWFGKPLAFMGQVGIDINIVLGLLNLIPIPPLDGSRILSSILPPRWAYQYSKIEPYGFFILIVLLMTNLLSKVLMPAVEITRQLIYQMLGL